MNNIKEREVNPLDMNAAMPRDTNTAPKSKQEQTGADVLMPELAKYGITQEKINAWKKQWGSVGLCVLGAEGNDLYIVRPIFADEYVRVMEIIDNKYQAAIASGRQYSAQDRTDDYKRQLKTLCTLWTNIPPDAKEKAGTIHTISKQIEIISNFMNEREAAASVVML